MISVDCETTGVDFHHGARPFYVTTCNEQDEHVCFDWEVDPYTRDVLAPREELDMLWDMVNQQDGLILQNAKFDVTALGFLDDRFRKHWPWKRTEDTLIGGHLLASGEPHDLTTMASKYIDKNIQPFEDRMQKATEHARRIARRRFPDWELARKGHRHMPSAKEKCWKYDMWLPKLLVQELGYDRITEETLDRDHKWDKLLAEYANADSYVTINMMAVMRQLIKERDLLSIYNVRMRLLPIALDMEYRGVSLSKNRLHELELKFSKESARVEELCENIASEYNDATGAPYAITLPKAGSNKILTDFIFNGIKLPVVKETKNDNPSMDKDVLEEWVQTLPDRSMELLFVQSLASKRKLDTAMSYMDSYQRFWIPLNVRNSKGEILWYTLHPSLNPTGTAHLRWSCKNPNEQNISKQKGHNLRYMFGPAPGREWWSLDAQNIELRIPTFEAGEKDLMEVFLNPQKPPYYGSYHLVVFDVLHPELFKKYGKACKDEFESTWYQWVKNGNFGIIYGAQEAKADATYHVKGAYQKVRYRFPKIAQLADKMIAIANKTGGIHTIPDRTVNPRQGYPIMCARSDWGRVKPTLPLNYHVSGTACQWMYMAMIGCFDQLQRWQVEEEYDGFITMQVHDEMVFDLPKRADPRKDKDASNLSKIRILQRLMEKCGDGISVPTPVGVEYNPETWDKGISV